MVRELRMCGTDHDFASVSIGLYISVVMLKEVMVYAAIMFTDAAVNFLKDQ